MNNELKLHEYQERAMQLIAMPSGVGVVGTHSTLTGLARMIDRDPPLVISVDEDAKRTYQEEIIRLMTSFASLQSYIGKLPYIKEAVRQMFVCHGNGRSFSSARDYHNNPIIDHEKYYTPDGYNWHKRGAKCTLLMEPRQLRSDAGRLRFYNPKRTGHIAIV